MFSDMKLQCGLNSYRWPKSNSDQFSHQSVGSMIMPWNKLNLITTKKGKLSEVY